MSKKDPAVVFETGHYNGMGQYRTDQFVIVDSYETGDYLIDKTIELQFSDSKKYLVEKEPDLHYALVKYNMESGADRYWNCMLRVHDMKVKTMEDIRMAMGSIEVGNN